MPKLEKLKSADYIVDLDNYILILECKLSLGGFSDLSIMSPESTAKIWEKLYNACSQCASSIQNLGNIKKPIIPIVLISSHITTEVLPFHVFAERSNLLKNIGIDHIEFFSWDAFLFYLSLTSIEKFIKKILDRKNNKHITIGGMIAFNIAKDKPAHNFEYYKKVE